MSAGTPGGNLYMQAMLVCLSSLPLHACVRYIVTLLTELVASLMNLMGHKHADI